MYENHWGIKPYEYDDEYDDYLMHYGIKGMKWKNHVKKLQYSIEKKPKYYKKLAKIKAKKLQEKLYNFMDDNFVTELYSNGKLVRSKTWDGEVRYDDDNPKKWKIKERARKAKQKYNMNKLNAQEKALKDEYEFKKKQAYRKIDKKYK